MKRWRSWSSITVFAGVMALASGAVEARTAPSRARSAVRPSSVATSKSTTVAQPRPTRLEFTDGDMVDGRRQTGDGTLVSVDPRKRHSTLIVVRQNFLAELVKSAEQI